MPRDPCPLTPAEGDVGVQGVAARIAAVRPERTPRALAAPLNPHVQRRAVTGSEDGVRPRQRHIDSTLRSIGREPDMGLYRRVADWFHQRETQVHALVGATAPRLTPVSPERRTVQADDARGAHPVEKAGSRAAQERPPTRATKLDTSSSTGSLGACGSLHGGDPGPSSRRHSAGILRSRTRAGRSAPGETKQERRERGRKLVKRSCGRG
jgi:hypothetical protein